jgi:hypothetical protein
MKKKNKRFLALMVSLCFCFTLMAQVNTSKVISVNYQNKTLAAVMAHLKTEHGLLFSYQDDQIPLKKIIHLRMQKQTLAKVLDQLCLQAGLSWQTIAGQIVLKPLKANLSELKNGLFQTIRGKITDKESGIPLIGVGINLVSTQPQKGTVSDADGMFRINQVPVGRQEMVISYLGFETIVIPQLLVGSSKEIVLNIEMIESYTSLGVVTVSGDSDRQAPLNEMASVSARSFTVEETSRYAAGNFDPARMAQNFAGVTINDDVSNDIVIRGNSPKGVQWRLEGIEINNPNHFGEEGSSGGGISMISANMLANSDFFTGAFPAEYGNALSGVFDLQFRKGNSEKREYTFMLGVLGTEVSLEGPFKKDRSASYLLNYRYSTLALLEKVGINPAGDNPTPKYQDLAFNFHLPTTKAGNFSLFGITGYSYQKAIAQRNREVWEEYSDKFDRKNSYTSASLGLKHLKMINEKAYLKNIVSLSYSNIKDNADTLDNNYNQNIYGRDKFRNSVLRYSGMLNYKLNAASTLRSGLVASYMDFDLHSLSYKNNLNRLSEFINIKGHTYLLEAYSQLKHQFSEKLTTNMGLHLNYFGLSDEVSIEPRAGLSYKLNSKNVLSAGIGLHSRVEPVALYFAKNELPDGSIQGSNGGLKLTKSAHFVLGYERTISSNFKFKTETYYQHLFDVPITANPSANFSALNISDAYFIYSRNYGFLQNKGTGENYGIELTLERSFADSYYLLLTSSLYRSTFKNLQKETFSTTFNGNYSANLLTGKEFKTGLSGNNIFGLNAKVLLNGGKRFTPIDRVASIAEDYPIYYEDQINTLQAPVYCRFDISATYRINKPKVSHLLYLDIQNLTNRKNTRDVFYNADENKIETGYYSGIIPTLNYKIEF